VFEAHGMDIQNVAPPSTTCFTHITPKITCVIDAEFCLWLIASFRGSYFSIYIYDFAVVIPFIHLLKVLSSISYFCACSWLPFFLLCIPASWHKCVVPAFSSLLCFFLLQLARIAFLIFLLTQ
jgi:hypothetical protein